MFRQNAWLAAVAAVAVCAGLFTACQKPEPTTVAVMGVSLDKSSLILQKGASETLTATVSPANASNKSVSWKSSDIGVYQGGFTFFSGIWRPITWRWTTPATGNTSFPS